MFKEEYTPARRGFDEHMGYYQGCESAWTHVSACCGAGSEYNDSHYVCNLSADGQLEALQNRVILNNNAALLMA